MAVKVEEVMVPVAHARYIHVKPLRLVVIPSQVRSMSDRVSATCRFLAGPL